MQKLFILFFILLSCLTSVASQTFDEAKEMQRIELNQIQIDTTIAFQHLELLKLNGDSAVLLDEWFKSQERWNESVEAKRKELDALMEGYDRIKVYLARREWYIALYPQCQKWLEKNIELSEFAISSLTKEQRDLEEMRIKSFKKLIPQFFIDLQSRIQKHVKLENRNNFKHYKARIFDFHFNWESNYYKELSPWQNIAKPFFKESNKMQRWMHQKQIFWYMMEGTFSSCFWSVRDNEEKILKYFAKKDESAIKIKPKKFRKLSVDEALKKFAEKQKKLKMLYKTLNELKEKAKKEGKGEWEIDCEIVEEIGKIFEE